MPIGKSQFAAWYCTTCNAANYTLVYNKKSNEKIKRELKKFCKTERKRVIHKRKDLKSGKK